MKNSIRIAAYHEAGHIVMANINKIKINRVVCSNKKSVWGDVIAKYRAEKEGITYTPPEKFIRAYTCMESVESDFGTCVKMALVCAAGIASEELLIPKDSSPNHAVQDVIDYGYWIDCGRKFLGNFSDLVDGWAIRYLDEPENKKKLRLIARALVRKCHTTGELSGEEIEKILNEC
jgi:hypothetical protein